MTDEQLEVARTYAEDFTTKTLGYPQNNLKCVMTALCFTFFCSFSFVISITRAIIMVDVILIHLCCQTHDFFFLFSRRFVKGFIEHIESAGIQDNSIDLAVSNCVINLSPDKPSVIKGVYNALRDGGELYFSDVYADRRIPESVREHKVLWGECLAGALYIEDFKRICHRVGFSDPRELKRSVIEVTDPELQEVIGPINFYSITYRCFKLPTLETLCEDYGQVAYYNGTIPGHPHTYELDNGHVFETGKPMLVCGNSASMLEETWLQGHFRVVGNRDRHYGLFDCSPEAMGVAPSGDGGSAAPAGGSCC